jgi:uncharacterized protein (DUF3820 family)
MDLCDEVVRLKGIADEKHSEYSEFTIIPFGKYSKPPDGPKRLADVPDDYLRWWIRENGNRELIVLESEYGPQNKRHIARQNLKLYDYIIKRFDGDEVQADRESHSEGAT